VWGVVVQGLKMAAKETRRFLETFREMTQ